MFDKGICDKEFIWNPSNCECEFDKSCDIVENLDYEICKCTKKLVNELFKWCTENVEEPTMDKLSMKMCGNLFAQFMLYCFQQFLQSTLETVLILFTTNTWIMIKKLLLTKILSIKQQFG